MIIVYALLMFIGLWMIGSGLRGLFGAPDLPSYSPLHLLLGRLSPDSAHTLGPAFAKLTVLFWSLLGEVVFLLAVWSRWRSL